MFKLFTISFVVAFINAAPVHSACNETCQANLEAYKKWVDEKNAGNTTTSDATTPRNSVGIDKVYNFDSKQIFSKQLKKGYNVRKLESIRDLNSTRNILVIN